MMPLSLPIFISDALPPDQVMLAGQCPDCRDVTWRTQVVTREDGTQFTVRSRVCATCGGLGFVGVKYTNVRIVVLP